MTEAIPLGIRPGVFEDLNFVVDAWLKSQRFEAGRHMEQQLYFARMRPRVMSILERAHVHVAHNPDDAWQIYGFIVSEIGVLHYVHVKQPFRRFGFARRLYEHVNPEHEPMVCTHVFDGWGRVKARYPLSFDPGPITLPKEGPCVLQS